MIDTVVFFVNFLDFFEVPDFFISLIVHRMKPAHSQSTNAANHAF